MMALQPFWMSSPLRGFRSFRWHASISSLAIASCFLASILSSPASADVEQITDSIELPPETSSTVEPSLARAQKTEGSSQEHNSNQEKAPSSGIVRQDNIYSIITQPGWFVGVEQIVDWTSGESGVVGGNTKLDLGISGNIRSNRQSDDKLLSWSITLSPTYLYSFNGFSNDSTPLRLTFWTSFSPLKGDALNFYGSWRGTFRNDDFGNLRVQNRIRAGVIYSFFGSRIIPDAIEEVNLPEKGFYGRIEPTWIYRQDGQLSTVETQAHLGWSDTYYPFTFAIEVGPQFIQSSDREVQTLLGGFLELGYVINTRTRAYLQYRPAISFGSSNSPATRQSAAAGLSVRF